MGHVKRAVEHALAVADGPITTTQIVAWSHLEQRLLGKRQSQRDKDNYRRAIRRAADQLCDRIGVAPHERGKPIIWRLKPELDE